MQFTFDPDKDAINLAKHGPTGTDWKRVKREAAVDAPIHFDTAVEPYDPNDAAAVAAYWQSATIKRGRGRPQPWPSSARP